MLKLNGCRRCGGDLAIEKDLFGWYEECLQCGYTQDIPPAQAMVPVRVTSPNLETMKYLHQENNYYRHKIATLSSNANWLYFEYFCQEKYYE